MDQVVGHFIGGKSTLSASGRTFWSENPATGATFREVAYGEKAEVDDAVSAAKTTFERGTWRNLPPAERALRLLRVADLILEHADELAELESLDSGGPLTKARADVDGAAEAFRYFSQLAEHVSGTVYASDPQHFIYSRRQPYGVVAAIAPWNFPLQLAAWKAAPAVAVGNSVVIKMAEQTPLSTARLAELVYEAGVPSGVLNVVHGDGSTGATLVAHPDVAMITFTGSTSVGQGIARTAADHMKALHLELGGKTANIILESADIEAAVQGSLFTSFFNSGQICTSGARLLVQESIADHFLDEYTRRIQDLVVGDPSDPATHLGPLVSDAQKKRVFDYLSLGLKEGATMVAQGTLPEDPALSGGHFVAPTVLDSVKPSMQIAREEIFGPITTVMRFRDEAEAIKIANDTDYGLATTLFTRDLGQSMRMSDQLHSGIIWTNCPHYAQWNVPYEGHKLSGIGEDKGLECIATFTELKVHQMRLDAIDQAWPNGDFIGNTSGKAWA